MKKIILLFVFCVSNTLLGQYSIDPNEESALPPYNGTCSINGVNVTGIGLSTQPYQNPTSPANNTCQPSASFNGNGASTWYGAIVFNFSTPVTSFRVPFSSVDNYIFANGFPNPDRVFVSTNTLGTISFSNLCGVISNGNNLICSLPTVAPTVTNYGNVAVTIRSTIPFTSISFDNIGTSSWVSNPCKITNIIICRAGNNAPNISSTSISNICPNSRVNLNSITANNQPANTNLTWHTSTNANGTSLVSNPASSLAGTYYAAFYDTVNNCYSPTSLAVTATTSQCLSDLSITKNINNTIPLVGSTVTFTLTATNIGPSSATGVVVTDNMPSGFTLVSATPSAGTWMTPFWNIGNLATGATATMSIVATVNPLGSHINVATIAGNQTDPYLKNNRAERGAGLIYAAPDNFSSITINGCLGGSSASVLSNDWYNDAIINATQPGMPTVSLVNNGGLIGATINNNGIITVPPSSVFGTYTLTYSICNYWVPTNCSQTTVIIKVGGLPIVATNDNFTAPINTLTGGTTLSVLSNDTTNGVQATNSNVTVSFVSVTPSILPLPTINSNGIISFPPGVTIGSYDLIYKIVDNSCTLNFTTAIVRIIVAEQIIVTPQLVAGTLANAVVQNVDTQSTGKIIITGGFGTYNGVSSSNIARLNLNLTLDSFISTGPTQTKSVPLDMKVIKNSGENYNKVILVGKFSGFNGGSTGTGIIRLNADGSPDTTFNTIPSPNTDGISGSNSVVYCCYIYPDGSGVNTGKILIGGMFTSYNGTARHRIARLHPDGAIDLSFNPNIFSSDPNYSGPGFNSAPNEILVQPDSKILVGGYFNYFNGVLVNCLTRLNNDGTIDLNFNNFVGENRGLTKNIVDGFFDTHIEDIVLDNNNNIVIGGVFQFYNGTSRNNIARLFPSGLLDPTFAVGTAFNNTVLNTSTSTYGLVRDLDIDGTKIYATGDFSGYQGTNCDEMIRLNSSGIRDFNPPFNLLNGGTNGTVWCMKRQGDGKIIIGGKFTMYSTFSALNVTRIFPSNPSFEAKTNTVFYDTEPDATTIENDDIITLHPNPSNGLFYITSKDLSQNNLTITVYSVLGQKVFSQDVILNQMNELNLLSLKKGTYFITFTAESKTITKTIIIK